MNSLHKVEEDLFKLVSRDFSLFNTYDMNILMSAHTNTFESVCMFKDKNQITRAREMFISETRKKMCTV